VILSQELTFAATGARASIGCLVFPDLTAQISVVIPPQGCSATLYRSVDGAEWENINAFDSSGVYFDTLPPGTLSVQYQLAPYMFGVNRPVITSQLFQFP
jgi:hypothetical protein